MIARELVHSIAASRCPLYLRRDGSTHSIIFPPNFSPRSGWLDVSRSEPWLIQRSPEPELGRRRDACGRSLLGGLRCRGARQRLFAAHSLPEEARIGPLP